MRADRRKPLPFDQHVDKSRHMAIEQTILALSALAQSTRLETFRLLVRHEPAGLPAGEIARNIGVPHNTMSSHLNVLARAGLVRSERHSRSIVYRADLEQFREVMVFLVQDCCAAHERVCTPLIEALAGGCSSKLTEPIAAT